MFYATRNLTVQTVAPVNPWEFVLPAAISDQIRHDKEERQRFHRNKDTVHQYYTGIEGINNRQRVSTTNPAHAVGGVAADFDIAISDARADEAIAAMPIKPMWVERSLGGFLRLVFVFEEPVPVNDNELCRAYLAALVKMLSLDLLPALDEKAFCEPSRLYANGAQWRAVPEATPVPTAKLHALLVAVVKKHRFKSEVSSTNVPLHAAEKRAKELFPNFSWPSEFKPESQGPTFWIPESTSPMSAIIKEDGIFTFSAHAAKPFYSWGDILGADWVKDFQANSITAATKDVYYASPWFWWQAPWAMGAFVASPEKVFRGYLISRCHLSDTKPKNGGQSPAEEAMTHIALENGVHGAAPFLYNNKKHLWHDGKRFCNTAHDLRVVQPSKEPGVWGPKGNFPYISEIIDGIFDPKHQKEIFLAWLRYLYTNAHAGSPRAGQSVFLVGCAGCGKTLLGQRIVGGLMGGFRDASAWLTGATSFGAELFEAGIWCADDTVLTGSGNVTETFHAMVKRLVANQSHVFHQKYHHPHSIPCTSRAFITLNLDPNSMGALPPLDNSSADKIMLFRATTKPEDCTINFIESYAGAAKIEAELPFLASWLLSTETPKELLSDDPRFGIKRYHEESLLRRARYQTTAASTSETITDALEEYFNTNPAAKEWRGTATDMLKLITANPAREACARKLSTLVLSRDIEQLQRLHGLQVADERNPRGHRVWIFPRFEDLPPDASGTPPTDPGDFSKK